MKMEYQDLLLSMQVMPDGCDDIQDQPYRYARTGIVEPDWRRLPGWRDVTARAVARRPVAARPLRQEPPAAAGRLRRPARRTTSTPTSSADQAGGPPCRCCSRRRCSTPWCRPASRTVAGVLADPVRRYMLPVRSDRRPRWPSHPLRDPRLAARARDVGGRGPDPPLPDQGAGRAGPHLPAVLRALHPDGPRRQLDARRSPSCKFALEAGRPAGADARLSQADARRTRRGGLRRRRRQRALAAAGGVPGRLLELDPVRDIRLATKALVGLPQHWLQDDVGAGMDAAGARPRGSAASTSPCTPTPTTRSR